LILDTDTCGGESLHLSPHQFNPRHVFALKLQRNDREVKNRSFHERTGEEGSLVGSLTFS
jgi:hypothetical protein